MFNRHVIKFASVLRFLAIKRLIDRLLISKDQDVIVTSKDRGHISSVGEELPDGVVAK